MNSGEALKNISISSHPLQMLQIQSMGIWKKNYEIKPGH
jgi:hypothetical protein